MSRSLEDPVVQSARREAAVVVSAWVIALLYTVGYCFANGYNLPPQEVELIAGIPSWVLWGIIAPWGACYLFSIWFSYGFMQDGDLGRDAGEDGDETKTEGV